MFIFIRDVGRAGLGAVPIHHCYKFWSRSRISLGHAPPSFFNEPGYGGWEGTPETKLLGAGASCLLEKMAGPTCRPARGRTDEVFRADSGCGLCVRFRNAARVALSGAILAHLSTRSAAIATTVETRIAEARS